MLGRMSHRYIDLLFLVFALSAASRASACDPNENCVTCQAINLFNGQCAYAAEAPDCVFRREACKGCISLNAVRIGASVQCVACVVGAITSGGAVAPACGPICGGAAFAERVANQGGC